MAIMRRRRWNMQAAELRINLDASLSIGSATTGVSYFTSLLLAISSVRNIGVVTLPGSNMTVLRSGRVLLVSIGKLVTPG